MPSLTYVYDDPEHPDRPTAAIQSPQWTPEDQALLIGLQEYEAGLCECEWPVEVAWHADMEGWFDGQSFVCHACSARQGHEVVHTLRPTTDRDFTVKPLIPFEFGLTTTEPTKRDHDD